MSMELMVRAMKLKAGNPLRKLVLIKLADNASDTGECWPSYQHIADQCEISRSSVLRHIEALINSGFMTKETRPGGPKGNHSNMYKLNLGGVTETLGVVSQIHQGGVTEVLGGGVTETPRTSHSLEPVIEPFSLEPSADGSMDYPAEFEAAWAKYPKRTGGNPKKSAFKAWKARIREGASAAELEKAVENYALSVSVHGKAGTEFVKQAATFFGPDEHWRDALGASAPAVGNGFRTSPNGQVVYGDAKRCPPRTKPGDFEMWNAEANRWELLNREFHDPETGCSWEWLRKKGKAL